MPNVKKDSAKIKYTMLMLMVAFIWGFGFIVTAWAMEAGYSTGFIMMFRFGIAAIFFAIYEFKKIRKTEKIEVVGGVISGFFLFLSFLLQTISLPMTTPSNNALITTSHIIFVPIFVWIFYKRRPDKRIVIGSIICFIGIVVLSVDFNNMGALSLGDLLTLVCAISFALHAVVMSTFVVRGRASVLNFYQMLTGAILSLLTFIVTDRDMTQFALRPEIFLVLYLAFLSTILAYWIQTISLQHLTPSSVAVITANESVVAAIFSVVFGFEQISPNLIVGAAFVVIAILVVEGRFNFAKKKQEGESL